MSDQENIEEQDLDVTLEDKEVNQEKSKKDKVIKIKESEHKKILDESAMYKDKHLRLYAEFENARKRMDRERSEFVKYANEEVLLDFLKVLDSLELSLNSAKTKHADAESLIKGLELVVNQIHDLFRRNNVKVIEAKGKLFDHNCHEVLMQEETDQFPEGIVIEEFQKGYLFNDRVLRTVKVKVAKAKSEESDSK